MTWPDPFIIAELSGNALGSFDNALRLVDAAHEAGADAIKTQCFDPETLTLDSDAPEFSVEWNGERRKLIELYRETAMPWDWHEKIFAHAKSLGLGYFASVFCKRSVDHIASLNPCALKIASLEITDLPLIEYAAGKRLPIILSCGMASERETEAAHAAAFKHDARVAVLHCPPGYPSAPNLSGLRKLAKRFPVVGLSDHTLSASLPACAVALGAHVIEKHLCLDRTLGGPDSSFSLEPHEFKQMVAACREAKAAMQAQSSPEPHRGLRRSLYAVKDISAGEPFTEENVRSIRPGRGLEPKYLSHLLGSMAPEPYRRGQPIKGNNLGY